MSWLDNLNELKKKLKEKLYSTVQSLEVKKDIDKAIEKLPSEQIEQDYYYDFVKDELVPKSTVGVSISQQTNQLISLLEQYDNNEQIGTIYEIEIASGASVLSNLPEFTKFVNSVRLEVFFPYDSGFNDIKLDFYIYGIRESDSKVSQILNEYFYKNYVYRAERVYHFVPSKFFQINFTNNGTKTIKLRYTFSFSRILLDNIHQYDLLLNNATKSFNFFNTIYLYNRVVISLYDASNVNADIDISIGVDTFSQTIKIEDITENSGTTSFYETYEIPASNNVIVVVKNNTSTNLTIGISLFFSNSVSVSVPTLDVNGYETVQLIPSSYTYIASGYITVPYQGYIRAYFGLNENVDISNNVYCVMMYVSSNTHVNYPYQRYAGANACNSSFSMNNIVNGQSFTSSTTAGYLKCLTYTFTSGSFSANDLLSYALRNNQSGYTLDFYGCYFKYTKTVW